MLCMALESSSQWMDKPPTSIANVHVCWMHVARRQRGLAPEWGLEERVNMITKRMLHVADV